jgi:DNA-binding CsgD family transcriptional regulator
VSASDHLLSLVDAIYSTVEAPSRWPATVAQIAEAAGAPRALLFTPHHGPEEGGLWHGYDLTRQDLEDYVDYYHQTDLWTQRAFARGLPTDLAIDCDRIVEPVELKRSEFYNDYLKRFDIRGCMSVMFEGEPRLFPRVHMSIYRPNSSDAFEPKAEELLQAPTPHLRRALDLGFRVADLRCRARGKLEALNRLDFAVAGLDRDGSIAFMNAQAERILAQNDGLATRHDCVVAADHDDNERLWQLLRNTIGARNKGRAAPGGWLAVTRPSNRRPYAVTVAPGPGLPRVAGIPAAWALVFITDPEMQRELPAYRAVRLYGLTPSEVQLAVSLASGMTLTEYAESVGLSMHTVRSTLKQVFSKTGTHRQADLVRLLLTTIASDTKQTPDQPGAAERLPTDH